MHWFHRCLFIAVVGTGSSSLNAADECAAPPPCSCTGKIILCDSMNLSVIPSFLKTATQYDTIFLHENNITRVEAKAFSNLTTSTNTLLSLDSNPISYVDEMAFVGLENSSLSVGMLGTRLLALPRALGTVHLKGLSINNMPALDPSVMMAMGPSLKLLVISMQGMEEWPDEMKFLTNLTDLTIRESPSLPDHAFNSSRDSIESLSLFNSTLRYSPNAICDLNHLNELDFSNIELHIRPSELISTCHRPMITVKQLTLSNIGLFYFPDIFTTFPRLSSLTLAHNNITYIDEHTIPSENEIIALDLDDNNLHSIPYAIRKMKLELLTLRKNKITSVEAQDFYNMSNLRILFLKDNPLEYISESAFINCTYLYTLDLSGTALVTVPRAILHLPKLAILNLELTKIECNCDLHWLSGRRLLMNNSFRGNCYQSPETIYDWVRTKSRLCPTSPIG